MLYTNPKDGKQIETELTPDQAAEICSEIKGFASDLSAKYARREYLGNRFSDAQMFWMMKIAEEKVNPAKALVIKLCDNAEQHFRDFFANVPLQRPKLRYKTEVGTLTVAIYNDNVQVWCGESYQGRVINNEFRYVKSCHEIVKKLIQIFAAAPKESAVLWGQKTGTCCFCARELTTPESVTAGYGPICADKWGLPWGDVDEESIKVKPC